MNINFVRYRDGSREINETGGGLSLRIKGVLCVGEAVAEAGTLKIVEDLEYHGVWLEVGLVRL